MCKLIEKEGFVFVYTEYNSSFVNAAHRLNGRFQEDKSWKFPIDIKQEVENLLIDLFGYGQEKVNLEISLVNYETTLFDEKEIVLFGKTIFYRPGRDFAVKNHSDVSIIKGEFKKYGGSTRYPLINKPTTKEFVFIVRNVPKNLLHEIPDCFTWKERENSKPKGKYSEFTTKQLEEMKAEIEKELRERNA